MRIQDVLTSREVVTIAPDASLTALLDLMAERNIGAVVVSEDGETLIGIVSERDVVRRLTGETDVAGVLASAVETLMTRTVRTCAPTDTTGELMQLMTDHRVRHLPVIDEDRLVGIVSIGDIVKARIDELAFERDQLHAYVHQG